MRKIKLNDITFWIAIILVTIVVGLGSADWINQAIDFFIK